MKGLSSGQLQKTTSFAQPMLPSCAVSSAVRLMIRPIIATASMLIPALLVARFTDAQTFAVPASASGRALIRSVSPRVNPLWTRAEKPPMKLTPAADAARSSVRATAGKPPGGMPAATSAIGVTAIRLWTIGIPSSFSIVSHTGTSLPAPVMIFS